MRGYFDEEREPEERRRDTELTLGSGALLAIFFGLVVLCGLCFGLGYAVGHRPSPPVSAAAAQPAAPDEEPLQASGSIPKPSAAAQGAVPSQTSEAAQQPANVAGASPTNPQQVPAPGGVAAATGSSPGAQAGAAQTQPQVRPALGANAPEAAPAAAGPAPNVHPALAPTVPLMVQIAAVANPEDANVLTSALRQRGYAVTVRREPADNMIHVCIGPFATRAIAEQWRQRLLDDGYNAIIQP
jgi:cell division septation protein DedD